MNTANVIGFLAALICSISMAPQVVKIHKTKFITLGIYCACNRSFLMACLWITDPVNARYPGKCRRFYLYLVYHNNENQAWVNLTTIDGSPLRDWK